MKTPSPGLFWWRGEVPYLSGLARQDSPRVIHPKNDTTKQQLAASHGRRDAFDTTLWEVSVGGRSRKRRAAIGQNVSRPAICSGGIHALVASSKGGETKKKCRAQNDLSAWHTSKVFFSFPPPKCFFPGSLCVTTAFASSYPTIVWAFDKKKKILTIPAVFAQRALSRSLFLFSWCIYFINQ